MRALLALGFDVDSIVWLAFVVFWVIAWLYKLATGQIQKGPPVPNRPRPPARPRDEKLQEEIDIFMQEVGPKRGTRRPVTPPAPRPSAGAKAAGRGQKGRAVVEPAVAPAPAPQRRGRPGEEIAKRHIADTEKSLGSGVKKHLAQHMAERVTQEAAAFVKPKVEQVVAEHLGPAPQAGSAPRPTIVATANATVATQSTIRSGSGFAQLFQNQNALRQAMVINLILSPPPGRKPRPGQ